MFSEVSVDGHPPVRVWRAGAGRPLLFLHGFEGHPGDSAFLSRLTSHRDVIAPELPGYAGSQQIADKLQDILDYALYFRRLIEDQAAGPVDLVGHDLGGMLAAETAIISPHLVRRLVLVDAFGLWLDDYPIPDVFIQTPEALSGLLWHDPAQAEPPAGPADADPTTVALNAQQNRAIAARFLWAVPERGLAKRLPYLRTPTLVLWGEQDRLIPPAYAQAFADRLAGARVSLIPNAGHLPMVEQPEAFDAALDAFLAG